MDKIVLTRRQIIKTLVALGLGSVFLAYWESLPGGKQQILPAISDDGKPSPEVFAALSSIVTLHDDLDPDMMQKMYKVFMDEPWGPDHILRVYRKIIGVLPGYADKKKRPPMKDEAWNLDDGEKWFANHLLTTWYLGIYYHEERPTQVISYENALMFGPTRGIIPVPFLEAAGFGNWAEPPDQSK